MERHEMIFNRLISMASRSPSPVSTHVHAVALVAAVLLLAGCVTKRYEINIYQYGINSVASDILKDYEISPQVKASVK
jgi:hypothetical protein